MEKVFLRKLSLLNFRNFVQAEAEFSQHCNLLTGNNGAGKTNLLDAIHYLSFTKSFFNPIDTQNIFYDAGFFVIQGFFNINGREEEIFCGQKRGERKQFMRNKKEYSRLAEHIGLLPVVLSSPYDTELITEGSEKRRKFADSIIAQHDRHYLNDLMAYSQALLQRNALLRDPSKADRALLNVYDERMSETGDRICKKRKEFSISFTSFFRKNYSTLSSENETVDFIYKSQAENSDMKTLLDAAREKDFMFGYSTAGIHRDDWEFRLNGYPVKKFASQGQQKTFLLAARLAQFELIKQNKNVVPVLMLDDIQDNLDDFRLQRLVQHICTESFGQVFITDTGTERLQKFIAELFPSAEGGRTDKIKIFSIKSGRIVYSE